MSFEEKLEEGLASLREGDYDESMDTAHKLQRMEPEAADGWVATGQQPAVRSSARQ